MTEGPPAMTMSLPAGALTADELIGMVKLPEPSRDWRTDLRAIAKTRKTVSQPNWFTMFGISRRTGQDLEALVRQVSSDHTANFESLCRGADPDVAFNRKMDVGITPNTVAGDNSTRSNRIGDGD